jgi:putative hydrolase of the HAD superfamily
MKQETEVAMPRAIIFDYGNVLSKPQRVDKIHAMATRLNVSVEVFLEAYRACRAAYDAGEVPAHYWRTVVKQLGRQALWSDPLLAALVEDDTESWSDYHEETWRIVERFRAGGGLTAFLSNNVPPLMARLRAERRLDDAFDLVMASCEVGIAKPDIEIFRRCVEKLEIAPEHALLVDDHPANIAAADRLGLQTFLFEGLDATQRLAAFASQPLASYA